MQSNAKQELINKITQTIDQHYTDPCPGAKKPRAKSSKPPSEKQLTSRSNFGAVTKQRATEIKEYRAANPNVSYKEARATIYGKYSKKSQPAAQPAPSAETSEQVN